MHSHSTPLSLPVRNLYANITPQERFERLCMFLEAQFGADNVAPITAPRLALQPKKAGTPASDDTGDAEMDHPEEDEAEAARRLQARRKTELSRLHKVGIPVPGVLVKVDRTEAKVWLEDLEIECANRVLADRVRAVVERAVEVTAPLWG